jgi:hypothetical protein
MTSRVKTWIILLGLWVVLAGISPAMDIEGAVFKKDSLPAGWEMTTDYRAAASELPALEGKFAIRPIVGLSNQVFIVDKKFRLQVNFVQCKDSTHAGEVARRFYKQVGHINKILVRENVVMEIITRPENARLKETVARLLSPATEVK